MEGGSEPALILSCLFQASYETEYQGGMGSNGLTSARHDVFAKYIAEKYPESFDPAVPRDLVSAFFATDDISLMSQSALVKDVYRRLLVPIGAVERLGMLNASFSRSCEEIGDVECV